MQELDHINIPLSGRHLIEASAGTGKTFAIALLYLRLVMEKGLMPEQILAVTYTEAATKELKRRIRSRIAEALLLFSGAESDDKILKQLCSHERFKNKGLDDIKRVLEAALSSFDLAAIHTIHSFCAKTLSEFAFECGYRFDTKLVTDQSKILQEIVDDFWRQHFFRETSEMMIERVLDKSITPETLKSFAETILKYPKSVITPEYSIDAATELKSRIDKLFEEMGVEWKKRAGEIKSLILETKGMSRAKGKYSEELVISYANALDASINSGDPYSFAGDARRFCRSEIITGKTEKGVPPEDPFFDISEELDKAIEISLKLFRVELVSYIKSELKKRKEKDGISFYDDLLTSLYNALERDKNKALASKIKKLYPAALIDEFQDTDPIQYSIFSSIYSDESSPFFMIGDPKQAIYRFRGGDIFSYLEAASTVKEENRHTLTKNWRSLPNLLTAFNKIFDTEYPPFFFKEIEYHKLSSGKTESHNEDSSPFTIYTLPEGDDGKPLGITAATQLSVDFTAYKIAEILNRKEISKELDREILPSDIAVIVRSHIQGREIQKRLTQLKIPSVMRSEETIFETDEAAEMLDLIKALSSPASASFIKTALTGDIIGFSGDQMMEILSDDERWGEILNSFAQYHKTWHEHGFSVMISNLFSDFNIRGALLSKNNGERILTNILQCCEILHEAESRGTVGIDSLTSWFADKIARKDKDEEYQIRLETDDKAVKILTVHISKGLEFEIVFAPFLWTGIKKSEDIATFYDTSSKTVTHDISSEKFGESSIAAETELLAESIRLFYVAITRAKLKCFIIGGKVKAKSDKAAEPESSPISYVFHASKEIASAKSPVAELITKVSSLSADDVKNQIISRFSDVSAIAVKEFEDIAPMPYIPIIDETFTPQYKTLTTDFDTDWRIGSFSYLSKNETYSGQLNEKFDYSVIEAIDDEDRKLDIFAFPKGAKSGIFLHSLLEKFQFQNRDKSYIGEVLSTFLSKENIDKKWTPALSQMLENLSARNLISPTGEKFRLSDVSTDKWLSEMEFYIPLAKTTPSSLSSLLSSVKMLDNNNKIINFEKMGEKLLFSPLHGSLTGFIDAIFEHNGYYYIIDWKSNYLGNSISDYSIDKISKAMEEHLYPLQYLIYTVALDSYLSQKLSNYSYEKNFGGIFYIFLRGVDSNRDSSNGIFYDRPIAAEIEKIKAEITGK